MFLIDFSALGLSTLTMMTRATANQIAPLNTTDQMLLTENNSWAMVRKSSMFPLYESQQLKSTSFASIIVK